MSLHLQRETRRLGFNPTKLCYCDEVFAKSISLSAVILSVAKNLGKLFAVTVTARNVVSQVHSAEKNNPVNCFSRGNLTAKDLRASSVGTFMASEVINTPVAVQKNNFILNKVNFKTNNFPSELRKIFLQCKWDKPFGTKNKKFKKLQSGWKTFTPKHLF